jgi:hypothetical protein
MQRLNKVIAQYGRWSGLEDYTKRIEAQASVDFSLAVDNAKSLLETICKEICTIKGIELSSRPDISTVLKKAFMAMGYTGSDLVTQISTSLANIGKHVGQLRNEIGVISHGKSLNELKARNDRVDELTKEFLIDSVVVVACFLIKSFEAGDPRVKSVQPIAYADNEKFNDFWDDSFGEFAMGEYAYQASEILYSVDYKAYETESKAYKEGDR